MNFVCICSTQFSLLLFLETVTTFSAKLCEGVALEGIVPIIFSLVSRGNRSEPSIELYRASFSILINLARYAPTKVILWDNVSNCLATIEYSVRIFLLNLPNPS